MLTIEYFVPMKKKEVIYVFTNMERFLVKKTRSRTKYMYNLV